MELPNVKIDFHVNGWCGNPREKTKIGRLGHYIIRKCEPFRKDLIGIANSLYSDSENRMLFLLDYFAPKCERVISEGLKDLSSAGYEADTNHLGTFIGLTKNQGKSWLYLVRGIEYLAQGGHLIAGATTQQDPDPELSHNPGIKLRDALNLSRDNNAILIPAHPMSRLGFAAKLVLKVLSDPSGVNLGLSRKNLRVYSDYWDAIEASSLSMTAQQTLEVEALAKELRKPTVSDTDGDPITALTSYNLFRTVDVSSPDDLRRSLREGLRKRDYQEHRDPNKPSLGEKLPHVIIPLVQNRRYA
jgi:hypothetical protein